EGFIKRMAGVNRWQLDESPRPVARIDEATRTTLETAWKQQHLAPKLKALEDLQAENAQLKRQAHYGRILQQLKQTETEIEDGHLDTLWGDETPAIVEQIAKRIKTNAQTGKDFFLDDEGVEHYDNPVKSAVMAIYNRDAKNGFKLFKDNRQRGSGH